MTCPFFDEGEDICTIKMKWVEKNLKVNRYGACLFGGENCDYAKAEKALTSSEKVVFT